MNKAQVYYYLSQEDLERVVESAIEKVLKGHIASPAKDEFLNIEEACKVVHLKKQTIYQLCHTRKIPHFKKNKRLYFKRSELIDWIEEGRQKLESEITAEMMNYLKKNHRA